jgi:hypothetical protein
MGNLQFFHPHLDAENENNRQDRGCANSRSPAKLSQNILIKNIDCFKCTICDRGNKETEDLSKVSWTEKRRLRNSRNTVKHLNARMIVVSCVLQVAHLRNKRQRIQEKLSTIPRLYLENLPGRYQKYRPPAPMSFHCAEISITFSCGLTIKLQQTATNISRIPFSCRSSHVTLRRTEIVPRQCSLFAFGKVNHYGDEWAS